MNPAFSNTRLFFKNLIFSLLHLKPNAPEFCTSDGKIFVKNNSKGIIGGSVLKSAKSFETGDKEISGSNFLLLSMQGH